jgi:hypothetical protein
VDDHAPEELGEAVAPRHGPDLLGGHDPERPERRCQAGLLRDAVLPGQLAHPSEGPRHQHRLQPVSASTSSRRPAPGPSATTRGASTARLPTGRRRPRT